MEEQHWMFKTSWFLYWQSQLAHETLTDVYTWLQSLKDDVDVSDLTKEGFAFLINHRQ